MCIRRFNFFHLCPMEHPKRPCNREEDPLIDAMIILIYQSLGQEERFVLEIRRSSWLKVSRASHDALLFMETLAHAEYPDLVSNATSAHDLKEWTPALGQCKDVECCASANFRAESRYHLVRPFVFWVECAPRDRCRLTECVRE